MSYSHHTGSNTHSTSSSSSSTTGAEAPVVSAALHHVLFPLIDEVFRGDTENTCNHLKQAFVKAERLGSGFSYDFVHGVIPKHGSNVHQTEALLRLAARPCPEYRIGRQQPEFIRLEERAVILKRMLCKIPDDISLEKHVFLERIKETAAAIRDFLDTVSEVLRFYGRDREARKMLDYHKKDFIKYSRSFSDTLKLYFRDQRSHSVFASADRLVKQTNTILVALRTINPDI